MFCFVYNFELYHLFKGDILNKGIDIFYKEISFEYEFWDGVFIN